jgi:hypothetical protein
LDQVRLSHRPSADAERADVEIGEIENGVPLPSAMQFFDLNGDKCIPRGPMVRIRFPPAESQQRTRPRGLGDRPRHALSSLVILDQAFRQRKIRTPARVARATLAQAPILPPTRPACADMVRPEVLVEIIVTPAK